MIGITKTLRSTVMFSLTFLLSILVYSEEPVSHQKACQILLSAIVDIHTGAGSGTGFLISSDGLIATAGHVVADEKHSYVSSILVRIGNHIPEPADPISMPDETKQQMLSRDFALLKVRNVSNRKFTFLTLGSNHAAQLGNDITVVGFPYGVTSPYCISGSVASHISPEIGGLVVPMIVYQGVAVHGLSGSPIFDNASGTVIGVVTMNQVGITPQLNRIRTALQDNETGKNGAHITTSFGGISFQSTMFDLINVLDQGLANGIGYGLGTDPIVMTLQQIKTEYNK